MTFREFNSDICFKTSLWIVFIGATLKVKMQAAKNVKYGLDITIFKWENMFFKQYYSFNWDNCGHIQYIEHIIHYVVSVCWTCIQSYLQKPWEASRILFFFVIQFILFIYEKRRIEEGVCNCASTTWRNQNSSARNRVYPCLYNMGY